MSDPKTYTLTIRRTLGIVEAELELVSGEVLEVVGPNASGKTSIATAAQAVLARELNPLGLTAPEARRCYPMNEDADAVVRLAVSGIVNTDEHDGFGDQPYTDEIEWQPAKQNLLAPAVDPVSGPEAVGLIDWRARKSAKERAESLQASLLPPPDVVMRAVREKLAEYLNAKDLNGAMETLAEQGWAKAEATFAERATAGKRQWQDVTGKNYGTRIAADWHPDEWHADWDELTVSLAEERVVEARDALAHINAQQAVSQAEAEAAAEAAERVPGIEAEIETAQAAVADLERRIDDINEGEAHRALRDANNAVLQADSALANLRNIGAVAVACPHCGGPLMMSGDGIRPFDEDAHASLVAQQEAARERLGVAAAAAEAEYEERTAKIKPLSVECRDHNLRTDELRVELRTAREAAERTGVIDDEARQAQVAQAEQALEDAKSVKSAVDAYHRATALQETIVRYTDVAKALGPQGVRQKMLDDGLRRLNAGLATLSDVTGWPLTWMAETGAMTWDGRPVALCSESEQWRAQACVQLTLGAITGSGVAVLDRADLLDPRNRTGLVAALQRVASATGIAVLLCATGSPMPDAPWRQIEIAGGRVKGTP